MKIPELSGPKNNRMIKMVVFDMAGTTVNEDNVVYKTVQKAINEKGFDVSLEEVLKHGAGKEKLQAIKSVLLSIGHADENLANEIFQRFNALLDEAYKVNTITEQDNASELFQELHKKNILVVLNTGYNRRIAEYLVDKIGWKEGDDFDGLITASDVSQNRPQPDMILLAMKKFNVGNGGEVVKVGDSAIDIEEGRNAGCAMNIGITTGAHTVEQLESADPDHIIDNLIELLSVIEGK
jgi:phosphonatase-like hydrolase